jgi:hypothetical protein
MLRGGVRRVESEMGGFPGTANSRTARGTAELLTLAMTKEMPDQ